MDNVISLVTRLQNAAAVLGDGIGGQNSSFPSLWERLPSIVVIGGQVDATRRLRKRDCLVEFGKEFRTGGSRGKRFPAERNWHRHSAASGAAAGALGESPCPGGG